MTQYVLCGSGCGFSDESLTTKSSASHDITEPPTDKTSFVRHHHYSFLPTFEYLYLCKISPSWYRGKKAKVEYCFRVRGQDFVRDGTKDRMQLRDAFARHVFYLHGYTPGLPKLSFQQKVSESLVYINEWTLIGLKCDVGTVNSKHF